MSSRPIPERQRWDIASGRPLGEIASLPTPLLRHDQPVLLIGGKLAAALRPEIGRAGFPLVSMNTTHPLLSEVPPEADEYEAYGNGYGEVDTSRGFRQLVERAARTFAPKEDRWYEAGKVIDPFRPNLRYAASSDREFDVLTERHLNIVRRALRQAQVLLVSLSSCEIWESVADGTVFPHWASGSQRRFDPAKHRARMLSVVEVTADLNAAIKALRGINPGLKIILMISPEPQIATAFPAHVLSVGALGKSILRVAMHAVAQGESVQYFPALEIATLVAPTETFGADGSVPDIAVTAIASALKDISEGGAVTFAPPAAPAVVPAKQPDAKAPIVVTAGGSATPASEGPSQAASAEPAASRRSLGVQATAIDPYTEAAAAEKAQREMKRASKRAARELAGGPAGEKTSKREAKVAEREARKKARAEARASESPAADAGEGEELTREMKLAARKARSEKVRPRADRRSGKTKPVPEVDSAVADSGSAGNVASPRRKARATKATTSPEEEADLVGEKDAPRPKRLRAARAAAAPTDVPVDAQTPIAPAPRTRRKRAAKP